MRVFLWMLRESGAKDVPSFDRLRQVRDSFIFYSIYRLSLEKDWANPAVRAQMHVYSEIPDDGVVREIWHALKWRKHMDLDVLSPMYDAGTAHYYVNELARLKNGDFVVPVRWLMYVKGGASVDRLVLAEKPSLSFLGDRRRKHVQRLSQKEIEAEAELMMALAEAEQQADEDEDAQPDDGVVEIPSEEELGKREKNQA
ncbi:hypothetical protein B0H14DRAFT_2591297 [Mycena olivaceomarginata]|nr:hypothetical protein B0H14DRAFT_2591297 [Mycena olivaceomarginata]